MRHKVKWQIEGETCALPRFTLQPHATPKMFHDLSTNGQAQAGALGAAHTVTALAKFFKHKLLLFEIGRAHV